tara:strand:+ start:739 stop:1806 length:1068 start_codon:yes stop_codon:yes gene_type:complete
MTKAAELAKMGEVLTNSQIGGRRNIVINGAMQVFQRGTSFTSVANTAYHADRFELYMQNEASQYTVTQDSDTPNGFGNCLKLDVTTADTSTASNEEVKLLYKIEGQDLQQFKKGTSDTEKMTLSFYVKTNKTGIYCVELFDRDNSREVSASYTVADANWNRYTITFPADTSGAFDDDNASSLEIMFWLVAGSAVQGGTLNTAWRSAADGSSATGQVNFSDSTDNNWQLTGVQLEVGSQATPFEHRSFGEELNLCMRYFKKIEVGNNIRISTSAIADTTSRARFVIYHNPEMRSTPTVAETNLDLGGTDINAIATTGSTDLNDVIITRGSGSHSTGDILDVHQGSNTATLDFAAEL